MNNGNPENYNGLTGQLVRLIQERKIIDEDVRACTYFVLDAIANAFAGMRTEPGKVLMAWRDSQHTLDAGRQAFLGGALMHAIEMDDLHKQSVTHPGCVVVPAALAVAAREGLSGARLLEAILHGYEAMCRVGNAVGRTHYNTWHSTATCGPFGSAMAAGMLLELTPEQQVWALGNAGTQSAGLWEFMNSGGMSKHLHAGRAAEAGILAADLAGLGFTGPGRILEGQQGMFAAACPDAEPDAVLAAPDAPWQLVQTSIKPWPCCRHTHPAIDAALELSSKLSAGVQRISLHTYQAALDVCNRPDPASEYAAKFSLQHCIAVALEQGTVGFDSFSLDARTRAADTRHTATLALSPACDAAYPAEWGCELEVTTADGRVFRAERAHCMGDPELPLGEREILAKAATLLDFAGVPAPKQRHLVEYLLDLPNRPQVPGIIEILDLQF